MFENKLLCEQSVCELADIWQGVVEAKAKNLIYDL